MSIVVAVKKNNHFAIAADSKFSDGNLLLNAQNKKDHQKIHQVNGTYIGMVGEGTHHKVLESVIQRQPELFSFKDGLEVFENLLKLQKVLKDNYGLNTNFADEASYAPRQLNALIVNENGIFHAEPEGDVSEFTQYWAIGSGTPYALGAIHACYDKLDDPAVIAELGIQAACALDLHCNLPHYVHSLR